MSQIAGGGGAAAAISAAVESSSSSSLSPSSSSSSSSASSTSAATSASNPTRKYNDISDIMQGGEAEKATDFANYFCSYAYLYHQKQMLMDRNRMIAYHDAIKKNRHLFEGKVGEIEIAVVY